MFKNNTTPYFLAKGPTELESLLNTFLSKNQMDKSVVTDYYVLYQFGQQQSLIKIEAQKKPFHFWYQDIDGRPAPAIVKETIARFLWEKCGEKERYLNRQEVGDKP